MAFSTVYDVKIRYSMDNRAQRGVTGLKNETRALGKEVSNVGGMFSRMTAGVAAYFGVRAAGKALIGFNSTVQDTKLQIAGMMALAKKTDLADQIGTADKLYARLQKRAATLPGTTQEYVNMAGKITRVVTDAGGTVKDLEELTISAVVAAKSLGENWEVAARDVEQALMGRYNTTDPFLSKILPTVGYKGEEGRDKWRGLSEAKRFEEMKRALGQKQISQLADAQGATFSGALSTLQDTLEQTLGKVGIPLFQAITKEIKGWNEWISKNQGRVDEIAKSVGSGLVKGFELVKDAVSLIVRHADTLIMLGKVWAGVKIAGMVGGFGLGAGAGGKSALGRARGWLAGPSDGFDEDGNYQYKPGGRGRQGVGGIKGVAENAGMIVGAGLAGYEFGKIMGLDDVGRDIGRGLAIWTGKLTESTLALERMNKAAAGVEEEIEKKKRANPDATNLENTKAGAMEWRRKQLSAAENLLRYTKDPDSQANGGSLIGLDPTQVKNRTALGARVTLKTMGIDPDKVSEEMVSGMRAELDRMRMADFGTKTMGKGLMEVGIANLTEYQQQTLDRAKASEDVLDLINMSLSNGIPIKIDSIMEILRLATGDPSGTRKPSLADKPKVNVHIARIEVQSDDPDRMAFGLIESFRDAAKNPSSALAAIREG